MKKILYSISILLFLLGVTPHTYAKSTNVIFRLIEGDVYADFKEFENDILIRFNYNDSIEARVSDLDFVLEFETFYNKVIIKDLDKNKIVKEMMIDQKFRIEGKDLQNTGYILIYSGNDSYKMNADIKHEIRIIKETEYKEIMFPLTFISNVDNPLSMDDIISYVVAYDNYDGFISDKIEIVEENYSMNLNKIGQYFISLKCEDSSKNISRILLNVEVKDLTSPIVNSSVIYTNYKSKISTQDILKTLEIKDNYSSVDAISVDVLDHPYESNFDKIGQYEMIVSVKDESLNETVHKIIIHVIDDVEPIITGQLFYEISVEETLTIEEILRNISAYDEIDKDNVKIIINQDTYSQSKHTIGHYQIIVRAYDKSNNMTEKVIQIHVKDTTSPIFLINLNQIILDNNNILNEDEILMLIKEQIHFEYDSIEITKNEYKDKENIPGVYLIEAEVRLNEEAVKLQALVRVNQFINNEELENFNSNTVLYIILATIGSLSIGLLVVYKWRKQ